MRDASLLQGKQAVELDLSELLNRRVGVEDRPRLTILPEAAVARLREAFVIFSEPCRFSPGDMVTPRPDSGAHGAGDPMIVLEIKSQPMVLWDQGDYGTSDFGAKIDMRVLSLTPLNAGGEAMIPYWVESWRYRKYDAP